MFNSDIQIIYAQTKLIPNFYKSLCSVANERVFIEPIDPPSLEKIVQQQEKLIQNDEPAFYAIHAENVVGWCDIRKKDNPRHSHRGELGMGVLKNYRSKGIGSRLLDEALIHAKKCEIEKVELGVYAGNKLAIDLYRKFGFQQEGLIRNYRKLDGTYFDCLVMAKFLL